MADEVLNNPEVKGLGVALLRQFRDAADLYRIQFEGGTNIGEATSIEVLEAQELLQIFMLETDLGSTVVDGCIIETRTPRPKDKIRLDIGEDPGVHIELQLGDGRVINFNAYGGIRADDSFADSSRAYSKGMGHSALTDNIVSKATFLNVNVGLGGQPISDMWLELSPAGSKPLIHLANLLAHDQSDVRALGENLRRSLLSPPVQVERSTKMLRRGIKEAIELRNQLGA